MRSKRPAAQGRARPPPGWNPGVSVIMPTYEQAHFIVRALESLLAQSLKDWELLIIDDGSPDDTAARVNRYLSDPRISYHRLDSNRGLGAALNEGLDRARASLLAYLPSDDVYHGDHLKLLRMCLEGNPEAVLAYAGVRREIRVPGKTAVEESSKGNLKGLPLQLVQVMHRLTEDRWLDRGELVTDDLDRMFWSRLRRSGGFAGTGRISCEWVDHPDQLHKVLREPVGGLNPYRSRYRVKAPLRFHTTLGDPIDEVAHYRRFRARPDTPRAPEGLRILLVGELAFNPERVLALEERGHELYGLWTREVHWFNAVGPMPFGHVRDLPNEDWEGELRRLQPDIVYALLNWIAVPFAHRVLTATGGIPFVWHFKESPFDCIAGGTWRQLLDLYARADGQIYCAPEMRDWLASVAPDVVRTRESLILDGDLPKREWFTEDRTTPLSQLDGEAHTVVLGQPLRFDPPLVWQLAAHGIHVHFYGSFHREHWRAWVEEARSRAPRHFHLHPHVDPERWVRELSQYDAGWLHPVRSENAGDLRRATWEDLNYPARIPTLLSAGVPLLQFNAGRSVVATERLVRNKGIGLLFDSVGELAEQLRDKRAMQRVRDTAWARRGEFTFDHHADRLLGFFRDVIARGRR